MFVYPKSYDVIVVGSGHAGVEAALAAARMGCSTLMITMNVDTVGQMSCNPAIGGLAKGHLVREIDALGGEMGICTDMTGIQFRMLNMKKGPAVRAPRAQCDKKAYQFRMLATCERQPNLTIKQDQVVKLSHHDRQACGVITALGVEYLSKTVVLTTGTFLRGLMHIGQLQQTGGRSGDSAAQGLSDSLRELGLEMGRLKTGTPPRLLRRSIDFLKTEPQPGDEPAPCFSFWKEDLFHVEQTNSGARSDCLSSFSSYYPGSILERAGRQIPCHLTYTTELTKTLIRKNLHRSPLYSGVIVGRGPRYCPSIEDKIVNFPDRDRHQVFLEPEGMATDEIYVNGLSTSLPFEVQVELVRTVRGCENAEILRPAYAVEYDYVDPMQLGQSLEAMLCRNLFLAGQINGTSGYEEAAAQGIVAGINAARRCRDLSPITFSRDQAYIGVLIDDLVNKGTTEPYRMFTSRAEHRILLRQDNADLRLAPLGYEIGLLPRARHDAVQSKRQAVERELHRLASIRAGQCTLLQLLKRPEVDYSQLPSRDDSLPPGVRDEVETTVKYAGYLEREESEVSRFRSLEAKDIPDDLDYASIPGLRLEARQKLQRARPRTIGQAWRISGVSPADLSLLLVWIKRREQVRCSC
jgi:tRNA uridine 5-carboxymethylaminomethyl modification enzyme